MTNLDDTRRHPSAEELLAYRANELSPARLGRVQQHLDGCQDCSRVASDLAGEGDPEDAELAAFWETLSERRDWTEASGSLRPLRDTPGSWRLAAAAALVLVALAAGALLGHRGAFVGWFDRGEVPTVRGGMEVLAPQALTSLDLTPEGYLRTPEAGLPSALASAEPYFLGLRLLALDVDPSAAVTARVRAEAGLADIVIVGLTVDASGRVELLLPRSSMAPGEYSLELRLAGASEAEPVYRYRFAIEPGLEAAAGSRGFPGD